MIARRWDRLGARLVAILNARSIADALGVRFRFVWPRGDDRELDDPGEIFDRSFLAEHEIDAGALVDRTIRRFDPREMPDVVRGHLLATSSPSVLEVAECFGILSLPDEERGAAVDRFRAGLDEIAWSPTVRELVDFLRSDKDVQGLSAVHVRAGDIVTGDWRHFMAYEKYLPIPFIEAAIAKLSDGGKKPVLVMSDSQACATFLRSRHSQVRAPRDICPTSDSLSDVQRALADILMLSRCEVIAGPKSSAFSHLGANLGGATLIGADRFVPEGREAPLLRAWIDQGLGTLPQAEWLRPFLARDICWYLDVFGEASPRSERLMLARRAVDLEPDFVAALARRARLAALTGRRREARAAMREARRIAATAERHADPLVEALATSIAAGCLALLAASRSGKRQRGIGRLRRLLDQCRALSPHQMNRHGILQNLSYQVAAVEWVVAPQARQRPDAPGEPPARARTAGLSAYRNPNFDPVLRDLERISQRICLAVGDRRKETEGIVSRRRESTRLRR